MKARTNDRSSSAPDPVLWIRPEQPKIWNELPTKKPKAIEEHSKADDDFAKLVLSTLGIEPKTID